MVYTHTSAPLDISYHDFLLKKWFPSLSQHHEVSQDAAHRRGDAEMFMSGA